MSDGDKSGQKPSAQRVVIVTGLSGAGKSQALKVFEDIGYFCVDNLPIPLLDGFLEFCRGVGAEASRVAIGMDIRGLSNPNDYPATFRKLRETGYHLEVLFLEADEKTLFGRYRETRRPHPLARNGTVIDTIRRELEVLSPLRSLADSCIDTTGMSIHTLRRQLGQKFDPAAADGSIRVHLLSFGYRFGVPFESDLVFDVRFLPNPHFVPELQPLDGRDARVSDYVFGHELSRDFLSRLMGFLEFLLPQYRREGKTYLTIGIGCTGGQHRSVAMVEALRAQLDFQGAVLEARHRELAT